MKTMTDTTEITSNPLKLRAHHGMCLQFFEGKGYSGEFTTHMARVRELLLTTEDQKIQITDGADEICRACPWLQDGICASRGKTDRYDREVLSQTGLIPGTVTESRHFLDLVQKRILRTGKREEICGDCQWTDLCTFEK